MGSGSEVITLQFGHYSNFIGSHWWNLQEANFVYDPKDIPEINYDVLFREGENYKKETTFTPRLLLVDLKGSLRSLQQYCPLYEETKVDLDDIPWPVEKIEIKKDLAFEKNDFLEDLKCSESQMDNDNLGFPQIYDLDEEVKVWSDYLSTVFHPRTINIVDEYYHGDCENTFDTFSQGLEIWKSDEFSNDWMDKCRTYTEECDYLQGFQVLFDANDGFSGLSCSAIQFLKDEYPSKCSVAFPTIPSCFTTNSPNSDSIRTINFALSFAELTEFCSAFVPLCTSSDGWRTCGQPKTFHNINYQSQLSYHSSALLATFLDTVTLPYRRRNVPIRMSNIFPQLTPLGRISLAGSLSLPFPIFYGSSLLETLENHEGPLWTSVTPRSEPTVDSSPVQSIIMRGISQYTLYPNYPKKQKSLIDPVYNCENCQDMFSLYLKFSASTPVYASVESVKMPLKTSLTFPNFFHENVLNDGSLGKTARNKNTRVKEVPLIAGLHNCCSIEAMLSSLYKEAKKLNLRLYPQFLNTGLEHLDYSESLEKVISLSECYT